MASNRSGWTGPLQGMLVPVAAASLYNTVTSSSQQVTGLTMVATDTYVFTADTDAYIKQGANPTASAAAGCMFVPAGCPVVIDGAQGAKLAVIRKGTDGVCTMQRMVVIQ